MELTWGRVKRKGKRTYNVIDVCSSRCVVIRCISKRNTFLKQEDKIECTKETSWKCSSSKATGSNIWLGTTFLGKFKEQRSLLVSSCHRQILLTSGYSSCSAPIGSCRSTGHRQSRTTLMTDLTCACAVQRLNQFVASLWRLSAVPAYCCSLNMYTRDVRIFISPYEENTSALRLSERNRSANCKMVMDAQEQR